MCELRAGEREGAGFKPHWRKGPFQFEKENTFGRFAQAFFLGAAEEVRTFPKL